MWVLTEYLKVIVMMPLMRFLIYILILMLLLTGMIKILRCSSGLPLKGASTEIFALMKHSLACVVIFIIKLGIGEVRALIFSSSTLPLLSRLRSSFVPVVPLKSTSNA
jgi:hypothetical protein